MLERLRAWVECESPSGDAARLRALADLVAAAFAEIGGAVRRHELGSAGDALEIAFPGMEAGPETLLLGHLDTVYPAGTLSRMPFEEREGKVYGPGVLDMKGGLLQALLALRTHPRRPVRCLWVPDEEVGSHASRPLTEALARKAAAVFVLEPGQGPRGALKTRRKGIAVYHITAHGRAAHAGVDFEAGASAVLELARLAASAADWSDAARGISVNPGVMAGGTRVNVVAARAELDLEIRAWKAADLISLDAQLRAWQPRDARVTLQFEGGINRPPLERSEAAAGWFAKAREVAAGLGFALEEAATGGGSDGNFTAALGVPTLDGLGMVGEGAHAAHEHIRLDEFERRTALLAGLLAE